MDSNVELLVIFPAKCISSGDCSKHRLYPGVARDRGALLNAKLVVLQNKRPSLCEAGVRCKDVCLKNCSNFAFFEMIKEKPHFQFCDLINSEDDHEYHVLLCLILGTTGHPAIVGVLVCSHL